MNVAFTYPPMIDEIDAAFKVRGKPVIFTWGSTIHNPQRIKLTPELRVHEGVHCERQGTDVEGWWRRYIDDPAFRYAEELPAHRKEYIVYAATHSNPLHRKAFLNSVAERLSSSLYNNIVSFDGAVAAILGKAA